MAVSALGSWASRTAPDASGSLTIPAGSDRLLLFVQHGEMTDSQATDYIANGYPTVTVGGQAADGTTFTYTDNGGNHSYVLYAYWKEATIAAMSGSTISYSDAAISLGTTQAWTYRVFSGVDQTTPFATDVDSDTGAASFTDLTSGLTAADGDYGLLVGTCQTQNRAFTFTAGWTEEWDEFDPSGAACRLFCASRSGLSAGAYTVTSTKNLSDTNTVHQVLFNISAVSGGSAGVVQYAAMDRFRRCS